MKNQNDYKEESNWQTEADIELNSSEWFGAILRYFWHLGRTPFNIFYSPSNLKKNALLGWLFKIMILILFIILVAYLY